MKNITGFLIRRNRLAQNLSQEGLCKGICAVSYLSKIEQGQVDPSQEIIDRLFEALGILFEHDEAFVREMTAHLRDYFDRYFHGESMQDIAESIEKAKGRLINSTLYIAYALFSVYQNIRTRDAGAVKAGLQALRPFEGYMDADVRFLYLLAFASIDMDDAEQLQAIEQAKMLHPVSCAYLTETHYWYTRGKYQQALVQIGQGFQAAVDEGNVYMMQEFTFIEGSCYACLFNRDLMLRAFKRTDALQRNNPVAQAHIAYNIGATFVEMHQYEEALPYLLPSLKTLEKDPLSYFLACHKLAIAYCELGRKEEGHAYLNAALKQANAGLPELYRQIIAIVEMRYDGDYLDSDEYLSLLREVYDHIMDETSFGFKQFHGIFLIEAYTHRRKYKEALAISREVNWPFS